MDVHSMSHKIQWNRYVLSIIRHNLYNWRYRRKNVFNQHSILKKNTKMYEYSVNYSIADRLSLLIWLVLKCSFITGNTILKFYNSFFWMICISNRRTHIPLMTAENNINCVYIIKMFTQPKHYNKKMLQKKAFIIFAHNYKRKVTANMTRFLHPF